MAQNYIMSLGLDDKQFIQVMDFRYDDFYEDDQVYDYSSNSDHEFQPCQIEEYLPIVNTSKGLKQFDVTMSTLQNTLTQLSSPNNLGHINVEKKSDQVEQIQNLSIHDQKDSKPKKQHRIYKRIETTLYSLQKNVKSYKGQRFQTMNLNKYYRKHIKDFVETLAVCKIIDFKEFQKYQVCNQIMPTDLEDSTKKQCQKFVRSTAVGKKILKSSKMNFYNKIKAIKYLQGLNEKINGEDHMEKKWKNLHR